MLYTPMTNFCLDFAESLAFPVLEIMRENVKKDRWFEMRL
jgi:hypothetical protein